MKVRTKEYEPKTKGLTYLKYIRASASRFGIKNITIPIHKIDEIISEMKTDKPKKHQFEERSNSVQSASISLCVPASELIERLNNKLPSYYMHEISELKTKIKDIEEAVKELTDAVSEGDVAMYDLQLLKLRAIIHR